MMKENIENYGLAAVGAMQGLWREFKYEMVDGTVNEKVDACALAMTVGAIALASYKFIKG